MRTFGRGAMMVLTSVVFGAALGRLAAPPQLAIWLLPYIFGTIVGFLLAPLFVGMLWGRGWATRAAVVFGATAALTALLQAVTDHPYALIAFTIVTYIGMCIGVWAWEQDRRAASTLRAPAHGAITQVPDGARPITEENLRGV
ncbi:MAG: hypothetical protein AB7G17_06235 [Phycisphaerales bacterium]